MTPAVWKCSVESVDIDIPNWYSNYKHNDRKSCNLSDLWDNLSREEEKEADLASSHEYLKSNTHKIDLGWPHMDI